MKLLFVLVTLLSIAGESSRAIDDAALQGEKKSPPTSQPAPASSSSPKDDYVIQKRADGTTVKYKKKTSYDFEGANVEGIYNKPSGAYISNIKDFKAKTVIKNRENFDYEVIDSMRNIK